MDGFFASLTPVQLAMLSPAVIAAIKPADPHKVVRELFIDLMMGGSTDEIKKNKRDKIIRALTETFPHGEFCIVMFIGQTIDTKCMNKLIVSSAKIIEELTKNNIKTLKSASIYVSGFSKFWGEYVHYSGHFMCGPASGPTIIDCTNVHFLSSDIVFNACMANGTAAELIAMTGNIIKK